MASNGLQNLMSFDAATRDYIKSNEGYDDKIYLDTKNIPTTGYGFNINAEHIRNLIPTDVLNRKRALTRPESDRIFDKVYGQAVFDARQYLGGDVFDRLPNQQKQVIVDMAYNMGLTRLNSFKGMKKALESGDMAGARRELLDSNYAREDVPNRALRNAELMHPIAGGVASLASPSQSEFKKAFAQARKAGKKTFQFNGKSYTTEVK